MIRPKPEIPFTEFNTNNAWGFGGGIGKEYTFPNGVRLRRGKAYFRHLAPERFERFVTESGASMDFDEAKASVREWLC